MMALAGVELETLVSESDALTTRPPPCVLSTAAEMRNVKRIQRRMQTKNSI